MFGEMCNWKTNNILFINKENSEIQIVEREFGCDATDSGQPLKSIFKIRKINIHLIYLSDIDTCNINIDNWYKSEY